MQRHPTGPLRRAKEIIPQTTISAAVLETSVPDTNQSPKKGIGVGLVVAAVLGILLISYLIWNSQNEEKKQPNTQTKDDSKS